MHVEVLRRSPFWLILGLTLAGCGGDVEDAKSGGDGDEFGSGGGAGGSGGGGGAGIGGGGLGDDCFEDAQCPQGYVCFRGGCVYQGAPEGDAGVGARDAAVPELEVEDLTYTAPAAGRHHVWVANPAQDALVRIHAETLAVSRVEVGDEPTLVRTRVGDDEAVVLNRGSDEVTLVSLDGDAERLRFLSLPHHFNALALHPAGRYAFAWFELDAARSGEDVSALHDVAVIDQEAERVYPVVTGFRPRRVVFPEDGTRALFVTEDGISIVELGDLERGHVPLTVPVSIDVFAQADREVVVTPDGRFAASRGPAEHGVTLVDLDEGVPRFVELGAEPTDLDLLPDGRTVLVMLREAERAARVRVDAPPEAPDVTFIDLPGQRLGSAAVSADGTVAVLFTTVPLEGERPRITLLDLETDRFVHRPLRKGIAGAAVDPLGRVAYVLHTKAPGEPDPTLGEELFLARSHGFSLVDLHSAVARLATTPAEPTGLTFADDGSAALVMLSDARRGVAAVEHLDLATFDARIYDLGSPPEFGGFVPELGRAFVTQVHAEGRISFLDLREAGQGRLTTVSGYALNGRID